MNNVSVESFINFCDDMIITEESLKEMNKLFDKQFKEIENIKNEINKSKGDYKKQIMLYKKGCNILKDLKSKVSGMDETQLEKNMRVVKTILKCATVAAAGIGVGIATKSVLSGGGASILTSIGIDKLSGKDAKSKSKSKSKDTILFAIDNTIDQFEVCIRTLNNPKSREKISNTTKNNNNNNGDATKSILQNRVKNVANAIQPLVNSIQGYFKSEVRKISPNSINKINTNKGYTNHVIPGYYYLISITLEYDGDPDIGDKCYDIIDSIEKKFHREISKYEEDNNCEITIDGQCFNDSEDVDLNIEVHVN